jgi:excisionase family DNA binding protein
MKTVFTTTQAAEAAGISPQTVIRCCRTGDLGHYLVPGSLHRRIPAAALREWMERHRIPLEALACPSESASS